MSYKVRDYIIVDLFNALNTLRIKVDLKPNKKSALKMLCPHLKQMIIKKKEQVEVIRGLIDAEKLLCKYTSREQLRIYTKRGLSIAPNEPYFLYRS